MTTEERAYSWLLNTSVQVGLLTVIIFFTFFVHLGQFDPTLMEARNFITVREITQNDTWLLPTMNGHARLAKPPLPTWLTALAGLGAGDIENLIALRLPSSAAASLAVFFLYFLSRLLTKDRLVPLLAGMVLASSFLFINIGRQATWDIYCHSFMLGAIWLMVWGWRKAGSNYLVFIACGILLGCSFFSKGPVAFYVLLIPFILAYGYAYNLHDFRSKQKGIVLALLVCLLVSGAWPLYVYLVEPQGLATNVSNESTAWMNRHVKPLWYYWSFPVQSGIWAQFALAALVAPYARERLNRYGNYKFLVSWVLITFILLSLIPEKKERYLMPILIPLALLTAHYLRYLIDAFSKKQFSKWDKIILLSNGFLFSLIAFAIPVILYFMAYQHQLVSGIQLVAASLLFTLLGIVILFLARSNRVVYFLGAAVLLNVSVLMVGYPLYPGIKQLGVKETGLPELKEVRKIKELQPMSFYAIDGMRPENIWEVGKVVDTLKIVNNQMQLPSQLPAVVFSMSPLSGVTLPAENTSLKMVNMYQYRKDVEDERYYMYIVSGPSSGDRKPGSLKQVNLERLK